MLTIRPFLDVGLILTGFPSAIFFSLKYFLKAALSSLFCLLLVSLFRLFVSISTFLKSDSVTAFSLALEISDNSLSCFISEFSNLFIVFTSSFAFGPFKSTALDLVRVVGESPPILLIIVGVDSTSESSKSLPVSISITSSPDSTR